MRFLSTYKGFYFIGIGGIGMSAIARYFNAKGFAVAGYDKTPSALTDSLKKEGIDIHFEDDVEKIPAFYKEQKEDILVIYTPAVPASHKELNYFKELGFEVKKRAKVLAEITEGNYTIAVAGTHGKTSTSAIIAHILKTAEVPFTAFLGGIASNYNTNFISTQGSEHQSVFVVEADEYDRSFLQLSPDVAIVTAVESDHLDIYGGYEALQDSFQEFAQKMKNGGHLILEEKVPLKTVVGVQNESYGFGKHADYSAENIEIHNGNYYFDLKYNDLKFKQLSLGIPGRHNIENSLAAIAATLPLVKDTELFYEALKTFKGVNRRFELVLKTDDVVFIDDYAHHPSEIQTTLQTIRDLYPNKRILGIFQPHLFSRTRDFAVEFAESLSLLDEVYLLPIYPAREEPMSGVSSHLIVDRIQKKNKGIVEKEDLVTLILSRNCDVIVTIGAGDIDRLVQLIKEALLTKIKVK